MKAYQELIKGFFSLEGGNVINNKDKNKKKTFMQWLLQHDPPK